MPETTETRPVCGMETCDLPAEFRLAPIANEMPGIEPLPEHMTRFCEFHGVCQVVGMALMWDQRRALLALDATLRDWKTGKLDAVRESAEVALTATRPTPEA